MKCAYCNNEINAGAAKCNSCQAAVKNTVSGNDRYPFKPLESGLADKVRQFAAQEFANADFSQSGNVYVNGNIPALELGRARKKIAPTLMAAEVVLFLWGDKKFKNGYIITDHRLFYKAGWFKKGAVNWSDAQSMMFKRNFWTGSHNFLVNGKKVFSEPKKNRAPGAVKDVLNRFFYGLLTGLFNGDQSKVPSVDFAVKEQKEKVKEQKARARNAAVGSFVGNLVKDALIDKCEHSPIGQHAYVYGQCRYCGKKESKALNI